MATFLSDPPTGQTLTQPIAWGWRPSRAVGEAPPLRRDDTWLTVPAPSDCSGSERRLLNKTDRRGSHPLPEAMGVGSLVSDGGVFALGWNAPFFGSAGGLKLVQPVVGIASTPNNDGYDLVASLTAVCSPTDPGATFDGSMGGKPLNQPVVGIAVDPGDRWLLVGCQGWRGLRLQRAVPRFHGRKAAQCSPS